MALDVKAGYFTLTVFGTAVMCVGVLADMGARLVVITNGLRLLRTPSHRHAITPVRPAVA